MANDDGFKRLPTNPAIEAIKQDIRNDERRADLFWLGGQAISLLALVLLIVGGLKGFANQPIYPDKVMEAIFGFLRVAAQDLLRLPSQWLPRAWPTFVAIVPSPDFGKIGFGQMRPMSFAQFIDGIGWAMWAFGFLFLGAALVKQSKRLRKAAQEMRALLKAALVQLAVVGGPQPLISAEAEKIVFNLRYAVEQVRENEVKRRWWIGPLLTIGLGAAANIVSKIVENAAGL